MAPKRARRGSRAASLRGGDAESVASSHDARVNDAGAENASQQPDVHTISANGTSQAASAIAQEDANNDSEDPDHVKILLATDNHVGYMERDAVRGQDSINTFREILQLAKERDVDFILLGGDLFHENRPSRTTLHQVMGALREFTFGDRPISVELLSDPNDGQAEGYNFPAVNYEDANLNVAIPIFSIHGNHDDPQGVGAEGALSAIDLLSVAGFINYFGKVELPAADALAPKSASQAPAKGGLSDVGIRIRPVLLQKGRTKVALYGMGNIKDERMHFELRTNRVRMYRPAENPDDWFNILTIHQNRAAHNPRAVVPETMFDDSIHLVVWGHEHEQLLKPQSVAGKRYHISQPGSSVATSLCPGEAVEKQVAIIHVRERDFHLEQIPLKTVRPFVMDEIDLDEELQEAGLRIDNKQGVTKHLKSKIKHLIARAKQDWEGKHALKPADERPTMMLPLVRLRIHYTRHEMGNLVRFGQDFVGSVANPRDLLQFSKKKGDAVSRQNANDRMVYVEPTDDMLPAEKLEKVRMSDLVRTYLATQSLHVLNSMGLERSVMQFVEKDDKYAISQFVDKELRLTNAGLVTSDPNERDLEAELDRIREEKNRAADDARKQTGDDEEFSGQDAADGKKAGSKTRKGVTRASERRHGSLDDSVDSDDSMLDDIFDGVEVPTRSSRVPVRSSGTTSAKAARGAGSSDNRRPPASSGQRGPRQSQLVFRGNSDDDETSNVTQEPLLPRSSRAAALAVIGGKKSGAARGAKTTTPLAKRATVNKASPSRRTAGSRASASRANTRMAESNAGYDDEDEFVDDGDE